MVAKGTNPSRASPAAALIKSCSAMPIWKNLSGFSLAKICRSVYFDKSADNPTISSRSFAKALSACPNGAGLVG
ncbi:hypothetical protein D3C80_1667700 [compost metagenome]